MINVVNIGGPLDPDFKTISERSLRPNFRHVDILPWENGIIADVNSSDLAETFGHRVRYLRATNVPFNVQTGPYVQPKALVRQANQLGVRHIVITTGKRSVKTIASELENAGWSVKLRYLNGRPFVTARKRK